MKVDVFVEAFWNIISVSRKSILGVFDIIANLHGELGCEAIVVSFVVDLRKFQKGLAYIYLQPYISENKDQIILSL